MSALTRSFTARDVECLDDSLDQAAIGQECEDKDAKSSNNRTIGGNEMDVVRALRA